MADKQPELEYLRELQRRYGSHYIKKYFGFSLKEIAEKIGLKKERFSEVLSNKAKLNIVRQKRLEGVFKEMQIEEKTKDFKESETQIGIKESWNRVKNA